MNLTSVLAFMLKKQLTFIRLWTNQVHILDNYLIEFMHKFGSLHYQLIVIITKFLFSFLDFDFWWVKLLAYYFLGISISTYRKMPVMVRLFQLCRLGSVN